MPGKELITVGDTRLFVDIRGQDEAPALLFIHGGPGQGCFDFMAVQGDRLGKELRVIGVDQRGALRSDPARRPLTIAGLIADFEELRRQLGISRWAILGHSFGGAVALDYATSHSESVSRAVFDCPCWDGDLSDRHRLAVAAARLDALDQAEAAERCRTIATKADLITPADDSFGAMRALGDRYLELLFYRPESASLLDQLARDSGLTDEQRNHGDSHDALLGELYTGRLPLLATLGQRALLLHGAADLTTPPAAIAAFRAAIPAARLRVFSESAHFSYLEEPDAYAAVVTDFLSTP
jgi:proline iminopeptidase